MGRNELYINVPSLFRCPISLDVMKSPVSLCTGVTYDRASIQHWLESGHDTCPATMQVLSSKDFVPNLTLHRLINLWVQASTSRSGSNTKGISEEQAKILVEEVGKDCRVESLSKISELVSCSEENRKFLVRFGGFLEVMAGVLTRNCVQIEALELVVRVLDAILGENGIKDRLNELILQGGRENNCLYPIILILQKGNLKSKVESVRLLQAIALEVESKRKLAETQNLLPTLLHVLRTSDDPALNDVVLSLLISITVSRSVKLELLKNGIAQLLSNSIINDEKNNNQDKALKLLATMCTCSEGRLAIREEPRCAAGIAERLLKVSKAATEDAVAVLWSMCCVSKDERLVEAVAKSNGMTTVLVVMQREGEGSVRQMCGDLVKALRAASKTRCFPSYQTKTTHIMPC